MAFSSAQLHALAPAPFIHTFFHNPLYMVFHRVVHRLVSGRLLEAVLPRGSQQELSHTRTPIASSAARAALRTIGPLTGRAYQGMCGAISGLNLSCRCL